MKMAFELSTEI